MENDFGLKNVEEMVEWANPPTVSKLKSDYDEASVSFSEQVSKIDGWLDALHVRRELKVPKGRSQVQPKTIRKQAEWRYPSLSEPFLSDDDLFDATPSTHMDKESAYNNKIILNKQFKKDIRKVKFMDSLVKNLVDEGTAIVKLGWETEEEEVEIEETVDVYATEQEKVAYLNMLTQEGQMHPEDAEAYYQSGKPVVKGQQKRVRKETRETINRPVVEVCDYRNVIIDPSCEGDFEKARFVIHRFTTDLATLKKDGRYTNLDKVQPDAHSPLADPDYPSEENTFEFKDKARKKLVVHEYWGYWDIDGNDMVKPIVAAFIGHVMIRLQESPFPFSNLPFVVIPFMPVKNSVYGEPDAELIEDNQRIIGAVTRGIIDLLGKSANGQTGIQKQALDALNYQKYKRGEDFQFNPHIDPARAFYTFTYPEIPRSALEVTQMQSNEVESITGKKAFNEGISGNALGSNVGGITTALSATAKRELSILRRISAGLVEIGNMIVKMNAVWLSDEEIVRITDDDFRVIKRDTLAGEFDLELTVATSETEEMQAQEISFLLQTLGNNVPFEFTKILLVDLCRLRKRHRLAKLIEEYKPEVNPLEQRVQQLEVALKEAQIQNEQAKALENQVDVKLKDAKAQNELAKAGKTNAEKDMTDLNFVRKGQGIDHVEDLDKEAFKQSNKGSFQFS